MFDIQFVITADKHVVSVKSHTHYTIHINSTFFEQRRDKIIVQKF